MRGRFRLGAFVLSALAAVAIGIPVASLARSGHHRRHSNDEHTIKHVLLISVDGMHQSDLQWYTQNHPGSELAKLAGGGRQYTQAQTPIPSDSFPGMVGQVTGGNPSTTGVYYDAEYNHSLLPAGTTSCPAGAPTGAEVNYFEVIAKNPLSIDSGQGLPGLPGHPGMNDGIMQLTGQPQNPPHNLIDTKTLPVDPSTCQPLYPHQYLKVNTVFNVLHDHGRLTAWSDKHVAYEILNGPSGNGIDDLFAPEINSNAFKPDGTTAYGGDWTQNNDATIQYDSYKVKAVLNEIDGYDHSHSNPVGVPAIMGMNFQTVSTAEKLPTLDGTSATNSMAGGYLPGTNTPGPLLQRALNFINASLKSMDDEIHAQGLAKTTAIILSAKHGQSPIDPNALTRIDDGAIIKAINLAWTAKYGGGNLVAADNKTDPTAAAGSRDDAFPLWLNIRTKKATDFVKDYLLSHPATGTTYNPSDPTKAGPSRTLPSSGLTKVYTGAAAAEYFDVSRSDPRHPDVWGVVQHGVVYTGKTAKIAEHGGADPEDRNVPLVVFAPSAIDSGVVDRTVETTQIAPTILQLLGFEPDSLQAVRQEGTRVLPGA
jgi:hypothetical protein